MYWAGADRLDVVREFLTILQLHQEHPAQQVRQAVSQALEWGAATLDGVKLCLHNLQDPTPTLAPLDLQAHPQLLGIGTQPLNLAQYDSLLVE